MSNTSNVSGGGIGFGTLTMIVLVIIKATGAGLANWNWFAVISSIVWVPVGLILGLAVVIGIPVIIYQVLTGK